MWVPSATSFVQKPTIVSFATPHLEKTSGGSRVTTSTKPSTPSGRRTRHTVKAISPFAEIDFSFWPDQNGFRINFNIFFRPFTLASVLPKQAYFSERFHGKLIATIMLLWYIARSSLTIRGARLRNEC